MQSGTSKNKSNFTSTILENSPKKKSIPKSDNKKPDSK